MYILMILLSFVLPFALLIIGLIFYKYTPKKIGSFYGYRTASSIKNMETWYEANKYSAKLLIKFSIPILVITTFALILVGKSYDIMAIVILMSIILSIVFLILTILLTEKHLKNTFGE